MNTTKDEVEANNKRRKKNAKWWMYGGTFLVLVAPFLLSRDIGLPPFTQGTASVGDTIGGITSPIVGIMGAVLVYYALLAQIEANKQINDQFQEQKKTTIQQNFEQTFFNLLNIHHEIVNNIRISSDSLNISVKWDRDKLQYHNNEKISKSVLNATNTFNGKYPFIQLHSPDSIEYKSREFFKYTVEKMETLITKLDSIGGVYTEIVVGFKSEIEESKSTGQKVESSFKSVYQKMFKQLDSDLGHYYRNLYRIIKMISEQNFGETDEKVIYDKQYIYTSIVRSQLSDYEIKWLFYNGLFKYGEKFKPLIEEFTLLKILSRNDSDSPIEEDSEPIKKLKPLYRDIAFEKIDWIKKNDPKTNKETYSRKPGQEKDVALIKK